jgi:hypothetical protein
LVKGAYPPTPGIRVGQVTEIRLDARGFISETGWGGNMGKALGDAGNIFLGLLGYPAQRGSLRLGFENADRLSIFKKEIIGITGLEGKFTDGDTGASTQIELIIILNLPARYF